MGLQQIPGQLSNPEREPLTDSTAQIDEQVPRIKAMTFNWSFDQAVSGNSYFFTRNNKAEKRGRTFVNL
jgi:hypothetical protein